MDGTAQRLDATAPRMVARALARIIACLVLAACVIAAASTRASETDAAVAERRIKAAFLVKFVEYVEWPAAAFQAPDAPLTIGVVGDDAMLHELQAIVATRRLGDRRFEVQAAADDGSRRPVVHMLYLARGKRGVLDSGLVAAAQPVVVVADEPDGVPHGATIDFVVKDARVQFEVSLEDAERRHLKLGSGLLSVARNLRRNPE